MSVISREFRPGKKYPLISFLMKYKFSSYFIKNVLMISIVIMLPFAVILSLIFNFYTGTAKAEIYNSNEKRLESISKEIDAYLTKADKIASSFFNDANLISLYQLNTLDISYENIKAIGGIQQKMRLLKDSLYFMDTIGIYLPHKTYIIDELNAGQYLLEPRRDLELLGEYNKKSGKEYHVFNDAQSFLDVFYYFNSSVFKGEHTILISIDSSRFKSILDTVAGRDSYFLVINEKGKVFFENNKFIEDSDFMKLPAFINDHQSAENNRMVQYKENQYVVSSLSSKLNGWNYILAVPISEFKEKSEKLFMLILIIFWISVFSVLILAFALSLKIFRPIQFLTGMLERKDYVSGTFNENHKTKWDEIQYIASNIMQKNMKSEELQKEVNEKWEMLKRAQSIALQAQINPHFLYNTLDTVNWKIMEVAGETNQASFMIDRLSKLLRVSLDTSKRLIPIEEEIKHARLYLDIQKMRYGNRIAVDWDIDPEALGCYTIKLTLQPIVENAIYHGIKGQDNGSIKISCKCVSEEIIFNIIDNGRGMTESEIDNLRTCLSEHDMDSSDHIGLINVNQRIHIVFGQKYGMEFASIKGEGMDVKIVIPKVNNVSLSV